MIYQDRVDAGKKLAERLIEYKNQNPIVLALPRGGVPIGYEIAKRLNAPLDVLVVRKLGAPSNPEFGIGAIAPGNVRVLDQTAIENLGISEADIKQVENKERAELNRRIKKYRGLYSIPDIKDKTVILVDDGLATGVTARAAVKAVLEQHPDRLIVAMPVCALDAVEGIRLIIRPMKDNIICLYTPYDFAAVGLWYQNFSQVSDEEIIKLLQKSKKPPKKDNPQPSHLF